MPKLTDIEINEVSFVARPANRRRFLIIKHEVKKMELKEFVKAISGEEFDETILENDEELKLALEKMAEYTDVMPEDLLAAVSELTGRSLKKEGEHESEDEQDEEQEEEGEEQDQDNDDGKPGIKEVIGILQGMVEEDAEEPVEKQMQTAIAKMTEILEGMNKSGSDSSGIEKVMTKLEDILTRLEVVEKSGATRKGLDSDQEDDGSSDDAPKWPSLSMS